MMSRFLFALCVLVVSSGTAFAADQGGGINMGKHDSNAPINVSADNFVGDLKTKVGTYVGNVIVVQGDFKLRADKVSVFEANNKPDHINGYGNVLFISTSGNASGDNGVYDLNTKNITLDGKVVLTKEKNVMRGTHLVMNMDTGKAQLTAKGAPGGRVTGSFTPPPKGSGAKPSQSQTTGKSPDK
ncbi:MAG TPA: lipopolysaccharide transport periplasmic protein LptA [Rhizomicrobium sp.]|jgi:lipopolysaccharide export system protein LptA